MTKRTDDVQALDFHVSESEIDQLRSRLAAARLPEAETVRGAGPGAQRWAQGVPLADLEDVLEHWRTTYDWRPFEARLSQIGQYRTTIDGLGIHFLHRRSARADATPLIMTHGWPGSIAEFTHIIDDLADPADPNAPAFHVVAPSLPGFGLSDKPTATGWDIERIAAAWVTLMDRLGYPRFLAHGGDWGGVITTILGGRFPEQVRGIHTTHAPGPPGMSSDGLTPAELAWVAETAEFDRHHLPYAKVQEASPQTLGYALVDSPVGLLAWILEKFAEWSDTVDSPFESIARDRLLDNVTLYWFTRSGASAARIYAESHNSLDPELRVDVPAAITIYPKDIAKAPRPWAQQRYRNIVRWRAPTSGGHFPSLECPGPFVQDLRDGLAAVLAADDRFDESGRRVGSNVSAVRESDTALARLEREGRYTPPASEPAPWPAAPGGPKYTADEVDAVIDDMRGDP